MRRLKKYEKAEKTFCSFFVAILLALALLIVLPTNKGTLAGKGFQYGLDISGGSRLLYKADLSKKDPSMSDAQTMQAIQATIIRRVNALGVTEPIVQIQGDNLLVELPNVKNISDASILSGRLLLLEFKVQQLDANGNVSTDSSGNPIWAPATALGTDGVTQKALTGAYLKPNTYVGTDNLGSPVVEFEWNTEGAKLFEEITTVLITTASTRNLWGFSLIMRKYPHRLSNGIIGAKGEIDNLTLTQAKNCHRIEFRHLECTVAGHRADGC